MKTLLSTNGFLLKVDDCDYERVLSYGWSVLRNKNIVQRTSGVCLGLGSFVLDTLKMVDHINGDPLNNVRSNLRIATSAQNTANQKIACDNKSGYKGVFFRFGKKKPWAASIGKDYKRRHIGYYYTREEAAKAYNEAAIQTFGEFARLNPLPTTL